VPFAFRDHFELWLLDGENQPLALLHSVLTDTETESDVPLDWRAGIAAQEKFQSSAVTGLSESPGAYLTRYVNARADKSAPAQWFVRTDNGAGLGLGLRVVKGAAELKGRVLDAEAFPPLFIATAGMDAAHGQLVRDYHVWQALQLLLLPHLDAATRSAMEVHARCHAEAIEKHHRLYSMVFDRMMLQAARVEAALQRSQPVKKPGEEVMSLDYIELNRNEAE